MQHARRAAKKVVTAVYGITTDSFDWRFSRLDEDNNLKVSGVLSLPQDREEIFHRVDALLAAASYSSPHTTPTKARRFAKTSVLIEKLR
jgi:hypothetical protein